MKAYFITLSLFLFASLSLLSQNDTFLYPFYRIAIGLAPEKSTEITLEFNNKVINLDKSFPTFYAANDAYFMLRLYRPLKYLAENDKSHS